MEKIEDSILEAKKAFEKIARHPVYPLMHSFAHIDHGMVDRVYTDLRSKFGASNNRLCVVLESSGGDIHAAYLLAQTLRKYATQEFTITIPRWAKSAATVIACGADRIEMSPVAELGPVDPQISDSSRKERFSPLHIKKTLDMIAEQFNAGRKELADGLLNRLQFPLTLGSFQQSLDIGREYLTRLISSRMLAKASDGNKKSEQIARKLVESYADHGFCIDFQEARQLGLNVRALSGKPLEAAWRLHELELERGELEHALHHLRMEDMLRKLPGGTDILEAHPNKTRGRS